MQIDTPRLVLIPARIEMLRSELSGRAKLPQLVDADVPSGWPPPLNDADSMQWTLDYLCANPAATGWVMWYFLLKNDAGRRTLVGNGGFRGFPASDGTCEVGYSVMPDHQRNGYATEAAGALVDWAFTHPYVTRVVAHTFPSLRPSIRVLEKCGFTLVGAGDEEGTLAYQRMRPR
jgi:RimJ/RimL family protein N-acetyltransferase